jgi:molybdate transport system ATP-binding protein
VSLWVGFQHGFPGFQLSVSFEAPTPGTTVLFGRSGSGKSTIAAAVSGLLRPTSSRIVVDGTVLADSQSGLFVPPEQRRIGVVFQESRLFPHLTVLRNLRYGLRRAPPGPIRLEEVTHLLGVERLLNRLPHTLSGGERQRIAIGRALLCQPRLLIMDEPLASLDAERKAEILPYLARLKSALSLPILYVTHSLDEVAHLADTLVLIRAGHVLASGSLPEIAARADLPLAEREDAAAILPARVMAHDPASRLTSLEAAGRSFLVPLLSSPTGTGLRIRVPAREVALATAAPGGMSIHNVIAGTVGRIIDDERSHAALVEVRLDGAGLLARVTPDAVRRLALARGTPVLALVKSMAIEVMRNVLAEAERRH